MRTVAWIVLLAVGLLLAVAFSAFADYDFDGDGTPDILWRNYSTGQNSIWFMNASGNRTNYVELPAVTEAAWEVAAVADFNSDSVPDILWRNYSSGANSIWFMESNGTLNLSVSNPIFPELNDTYWRVYDVDDYNGDDKADILWRNDRYGNTALWFMDNDGNSTLPTISFRYISKMVDFNWTIIDAIDMNADDIPDIVWRNTSTGENAYWEMATGGELVEPHAVRQLSNDWTLASIGDMNADDVPDFVWRNYTNGNFAMWYMDSSGNATSTTLLFDVSTDWRIVGAIDFNVDGIPDLMWHNSYLQQFSIWFLDSEGQATSTAVYDFISSNWKAISPNPVLNKR